MNDKELEDIVNNIDCVVVCLKTQVEHIVNGGLSDEAKANRLANLVEGQGAALLALKMDLEDRAGRRLKSPIIFAELDVNPCSACIVVSQMGEKGLVEDCKECEMAPEREAFIATQTDGSG